MIAGNHVEGDVKGPLVIKSLQDTTTFDRQQASVGGSVTIGYGFSDSASASASKAKGDFASVKEQSGNKAGDGGFDLHVDGTTSLNGAANATVNNYLNHTKITQKSAELAQCTADPCRTAVSAKWTDVSQSQNATAVDSCLNGGAAQCSQNVDRITRDIVGLTADGRDLSKGYTGYTPEERNNIKQAMAVATNLELVAAEGNKRLGMTSTTPDALAAAGFLTIREAEMLKSIRADNMVGFLGAVTVQRGVVPPTVASKVKAPALLDELTARGTKFTPENVVQITKLDSGKLYS